MADQIDKLWLEEKFAHLGTRLDHFMERLEKADQNAVRCQTTCNTQLEELFTRVRRVEISAELNSDWRKREERKAGELPHWAHAAGSWAKVVWMAVGGLIGVVVYFLSSIHK